MKPVALLICKNPKSWVLCTLSIHRTLARNNTMNEHSTLPYSYSSVEQVPNAKGAAFPDANICFKGSPVNSCVLP